MRKILLLFSLIPLFSFGQKLDMTFKNEYCQVIAKTGGQLLLGEFFENSRVETAQIMTKHDKLNTLTVSLYPIYPTIGTKIEINKLYKYGSEVVQIVKEGIVTTINPKDDKELVSYYRPETGNLQWIEKEKVIEGNIRIYKEITYICLIAHFTSIDLTPDKNDKLWKVNKGKFIRKK